MGEEPRDIYREAVDAVAEPLLGRDDSERFRECREGKEQTIANREQYGDRLRCHADKDGDCESSDCPQLRDGEPSKTGRHCPIDTWPDETEW